MWFCILGGQTGSVSGWEDGVTHQARVDPVPDPRHLWGSRRILTDTLQLMSDTNPLPELCQCKWRFVSLVTGRGKAEHTWEQGQVRTGPGASGCPAYKARDRYPPGPHLRSGPHPQQTRDVEPNVGLMLGHGRRRWPSIKTTFVQRLVFVRTRQGGWLLGRSS